MAFAILDPSDLIEGEMFREDAFLERAAAFDWSQYNDQQVLVRGCSTIVPPWIYMLITARLTGRAKSVRYGNEHDNVVVFRRAKTVSSDSK